MMETWRFLGIWNHPNLRNLKIDIVQAFEKLIGEITDGKIITNKKK